MISNTGDSIKKLSDYRDGLRTVKQDFSICNFMISDLRIHDEKIKFGDSTLSEKATKKILSHLRVKNNFLGLSKMMNVTDWKDVEEKLKRASGSQPVFARMKGEGEFSTIEELYVSAPKVTSTIESDQIFSEIIESIISTGKDISVESVFQLEETGENCVILIENDNVIDIFKNESDIWTTGKMIIWNELSFSINTIFYRKNDSSLCVLSRKGFKANVSSNKFNLDKIRKILEKEITLVSDRFNNSFIDSVHHFKHNNISVREFERFKNLFQEGEEEDSEILKKFDETEMNKAYGRVVSEMPQQWQSTADSGINSYAFFCEMCNVATHDVKDLKKKVEVQNRLADFLFRSKLDLEFLAPKLSWKKEETLSATV